jgi:hypothetical protein
MQSIFIIHVIKATVQLVQIHTTLQVIVIRVVISDFPLWCLLEIILNYCTDVQFVCVCLICTYFGSLSGCRLVITVCVLMFIGFMCVNFRNNVHISVTNILKFMSHFSGNAVLKMPT